jgi:hypothetical protein
VDEAQLNHAWRDLERYAKLAPLDYTRKITLGAASALVAQFVAVRMHKLIGMA